MPARGPWRWCNRASRAPNQKGTSRSVGNHHAVAEELGDGLDIRCLAATRARARELEQRLCELRTFNGLVFLDHVVAVAHLVVHELPIFLLVHL